MNKKNACIKVIALVLLGFQNSHAQNTPPYWSLAGNSNATTTSKLGTTNGVSLRFYANNVQRMLIGYSSGNVSIGSTALNARLTVNAASGSDVLLGQLNGTTKLRAASNGGLAIGSGSTPPSNGLYVAGNVGIGTASAASKLTIAGSGSYTTAARISNGGLQVLNNWSTGDSSVGIYAEGGTGVSGSGMTGIYGSGMTGVYGTGYMGVQGQGISGGSGISGYSADGSGAEGSSESYDGVHGSSTAGNGGNFISQAGWGLRASTETGAYAGVFYGKVWSSGGYYPSDKNLKQNVQEFENAMGLINELKPRHYSYKKDAAFAFLKLPAGNHYGLMAQDVETVLPDLVSTDAHEVRKPEQPFKAPEKPTSMQKPPARETPQTLTVKSINYIELIPILVKGLQEQDEQNNKQQGLIENLLKEIDALKNQILELKGSANRVTASGALSQNSPNPASYTTRISYTLPQGVSRAQLAVTDNLGRTVKTISLNALGYTDLDVRTLSNGIYNYAMLIDGKIVETKKLNVIR